MKAVIFDLDGTILDRSGSLIDFIQWQVNKILKTEIRNKDDFVKRFIQLDDSGRVWKDRVYESLIQEFDIRRWSAEELLHIYELCFCAFCIPMDGVELAIKKLHEEGCKIGMVSNGKTPFQELNFDSLGLSKYFSSVLVSELVGMRKPEKAIFELCCQELGVPVKNAIFVGDNPVADIQGASEAGLKTIFIPGHIATECHLADNTCTNYDVLADLVRPMF